MCHYCGCRQMPLIRDYIAEHERATQLGGDAVRAIHRGELEPAQKMLAEMATELEYHWRGEEDGLFPASVVELSGAEWDAAIEAWQLAHPGSRLSGGSA
jgi:hypothetical protein